MRHREQPAQKQMQPQPEDKRDIDEMHTSNIGYSASVPTETITTDRRKGKKDRRQQAMIAEKNDVRMLIVLFVGFHVMFCLTFVLPMILSKN